MDSCALCISELSWWTTDNDIIKISQLATKDPNCVVDLSFNEHKVNGKSKGSVWVLFKTIEQAAKTKTQFESIEIDQRVPQVSFSNPNLNMYRTLPKESNIRSNQRGTQRGRFRRSLLHSKYSK